MKYLKQLMREGKINLDSNSDRKQVWTVDDHTVILEKEVGRELRTCTCEGYTINSKSPVMCKHRDAVILYKAYKPIHESIKEFIMMATINDKHQKKEKSRDRAKKVFDYLENIKLKPTDEKYAEAFARHYDTLIKRATSHSLYKMLMEDLIK